MGTACRLGEGRGQTARRRQAALATQVQGPAQAKSMAQRKGHSTVKTAAAVAPMGPAAAATAACLGRACCRPRRSSGSGLSRYGCSTGADAHLDGRGRGIWLRPAAQSAPARTAPPSGPHACTQRGRTRDAHGCAQEWAGALQRHASWARRDQSPLQRPATPGSASPTAGRVVSLPGSLPGTGALHQANHCVCWRVLVPVPCAPRPNPPHPHRRIKPTEHTHTTTTTHKHT